MGIETSINEGEERDLSRSLIKAFGSRSGLVTQSTNLALISFFSLQVLSMPVRLTKKQERERKENEYTRRRDRNYEARLEWIP